MAQQRQELFCDISVSACVFEPCFDRWV